MPGFDDDSDNLNERRPMGARNGDGGIDVFPNGVPEWRNRRYGSNGAFRRLRAFGCAQVPATAIMEADGSPWGKAGSAVIGYEEGPR